MRPTFQLGNSVINRSRLQKDHQNLPIRVAGVVFYSFNDKTQELSFLMVTRPNGTVETLCGKSDFIDKNIHDLIRREVEEESMHVIQLDTRHTSNSTTWAYFDKCCLHFLPVHDQGVQYGWNNPNTFGDYEIGTGVDDKDNKDVERVKGAERQVQWLTISQISMLKMIKYNPNAFNYYCTCLYQRLVNLNHIYQKYNHVEHIGDLLLIHLDSKKPSVYF